MAYILNEKCNKRAYASAKDAKSSQNKNSKRIRAYLCPKCHFWHITAAAVYGKGRKQGDDY